MFLISKPLCDFCKQDYYIEKLYTFRNQVDLTNTVGGIEIKVIDVYSVLVTNNLDIEKIEHKIKIYQIYHTEGGDEG